MAFIILWVLFPVVAAAIAAKKGRSGIGWFCLGLLIGPFALVVILLAGCQAQEQARTTGAGPGYKKCPYCAEAIRVEAAKCRYCQGELAQPPCTPAPVEAYRDNDIDYHAWIMEHPDGFVLNCYREHRPHSYLEMHLATCLSVCQGDSTAQKDPLTGGQYFKVCSLDQESLRAWGYRQGYQREVLRCTHCGVGHV